MISKTFFSVKQGRFEIKSIRIVSFVQWNFVFFIITNVWNEICLAPEIRIIVVLCFFSIAPKLFPPVVYLFIWSWADLWWTWYTLITICSDGVLLSLSLNPMNQRYGRDQQQFATVQYRNIGRVVEVFVLFYTCSQFFTYYYLHIQIVFKKSTIKLYP